MTPPGVGRAHGPVIHAVDVKPDNSRGVIKLVRKKGETTNVAPNAIVVTTLYEELCNLPCGVQIDNSERSMFFFIRDGKPASYPFRLPSSGEHTLELRAYRHGMRTAGVYLTYMLLLPVSIPLLVAGGARVKIAPGNPDSATEFERLKKAR